MLQVNGEELNEVVGLWLEMKRAGALARTCRDMTDTIMDWLENPTENDFLQQS